MEVAHVTRDSDAIVKVTGEGILWWPPAQLVNTDLRLSEDTVQCNSPFRLRVDDDADAITELYRKIMLFAR